MFQLPHRSRTPKQKLAYLSKCGSGSFFPTEHAKYKAAVSQSMSDIWVDLPEGISWGTLFCAISHDEMPKCYYLHKQQSCGCSRSWLRVMVTDLVEPVLVL